MLRRLLLVEWSGLLAAIVIGGAVLAVLAPNFLTEFNIYVMLRSFCVALLVGFAQMVTLGVGQMNIAVGALGGLVAISLGGMLDVPALDSRSSQAPLGRAVKTGTGRPRDARPETSRQRARAHRLRPRVAASHRRR